MLHAAADIYAPLTLSWYWPIIGIGGFIAVVGGYYVLRWLRKKIALALQRRAAIVPKPHKNQIIAKALQEITQIKQAVERGSLPADQGALRISAVVRGAFDLIMNHRTLYAAKFEVAQRHLTTLENMLTVNYPVTFNPPTHDQQGFAAACAKAVEVIEACR